MMTPREEKDPENLEIICPILPSMPTVQDRPSFEEMLASIFDAHLDDFLFSVDMKFDVFGDP